MLASLEDKQRRRTLARIAILVIIPVAVGILGNLVTAITDPTLWGVIIVGLVVLIAVWIAIEYNASKSTVEPLASAQLVIKPPQSAPPPAATQTTYSIPLPDLPTNVLARDHELNELEPLFAKRDTVVVVGKGGQGKTTFANLYAHRWQAQSRKLFWYDAAVNGRRGGDQIAVAALACLGWRDDHDYQRSQYQQAGSLGNLLADRVQQAAEPWLLVVSGLDESDRDDDMNLRDPELNALLARACTGLGAGGLLLTARDRVRHGGNYDQSFYYQLRRLEPAASLELLAGKLDSRLHLPADKLKQAVGPGFAEGYPFALALLANLLNDAVGADADSYLDELLTRPGEWYSEQSGSGRLLDDIWASLGRNPVRQRMIQYVAAFHRAVTADEIKGMLAALEPPVNFDGHVLRDLAHSDLVEQSRSGNETVYSLHPLLRSYALSHWVEEAKRHHQAAADYFRSTYKHDPQTNPPKRLSNVQPLLAAFEQYILAGQYAEASKLMNASVEDRGGGMRLDLQGAIGTWSEYRLLLNVQQQLVGAPAGSLDDQQISIAHLMLGSAYHNVGEYSLALANYQLSLQAAVEAGDKTQENKALGKIGLAYSSVGNYNAAEQYYKRALALAQQVDDALGVGDHTSGLGSLYRRRGQLQEAIDNYEQALAVARRIGDARGEGNRLGHIGETYRIKGDHQQASIYLTEALSVTERIGDIRGQASQFYSFGKLFIEQERKEVALACFLKALAIRKLLGNLAEAEIVEQEIDSTRRQVGEAAWPAFLAEAERLAAQPNWRPPVPEQNSQLPNLAA